MQLSWANSLFFMCLPVMKLRGVLHHDVWFCKWGIENSILCVCVPAKIYCLVLYFCDAKLEAEEIGLLFLFIFFCVQQTAELCLCACPLSPSVTAERMSECVCGGVCLWVVGLSSGGKASDVQRDWGRSRLKCEIESEMVDCLSFNWSCL